MHWKTAQYIMSVVPGHTSSMSSLFLFFPGLIVLTVSGKVLPCCFTSILLGFRGVNWISISGLGNRLVFPLSVDTSEESRTTSEQSCKHIEIKKRSFKRSQKVSYNMRPPTWIGKAFSFLAASFWTTYNSSFKIYFNYSRIQFSFSNILSTFKS